MPHINFGQSWKTSTVEKKSFIEIVRRLMKNPQRRHPRSPLLDFLNFFLMYILNFPHPWTWRWHSWIFYPWAPIGTCAHPWKPLFFRGWGVIIYGCGLSTNGVQLNNFPARFYAWEVWCLLPSKFHNFQLHTGLLAREQLLYRPGRCIRWPIR